MGHDPIRALRALVSAGKEKEAILECERLLGRNPNDAESHVLQGLLLQMTARPNEAIAAYDMALTLAPEFPWAYVGIAEILADKGWIHSAVVVMENARASAGFIPEAQTLLDTLHDRVARARGSTT